MSLNLFWQNENCLMKKFWIKNFILAWNKTLKLKKKLFDRAVTRVRKIERVGPRQAEVSFTRISCEIIQNLEISRENWVFRITLVTALLRNMAQSSFL